ncbi:hypothetical protein QBC37DRAFT_37975 [Rhypophila decipiens]|uniref:Uncharacterized protein n=1 Tax=Rhypophila decipiens TaxID=261697 RepID=A0AAN6YFD7_9PEZI|nr:hypothetical protein QBC37DRAFT_37975 [Rhypophila decipiens]
MLSQPAIIANMKSKPPRPTRFPEQIFDPSSNTNPGSKHSTTATTKKRRVDTSGSNFDGSPLYAGYAETPYKLRLEILKINHKSAPRINQSAAGPSVGNTIPGTSANRELWPTDVDKNLERTSAHNLKLPLNPMASCPSQPAVRYALAVMPARSSATLLSINGSPAANRIGKLSNVEMAV